LRVYETRGALSQMQKGSYAFPRKARCKEAEHRSISDDVRVSPVMVTAKVTKGKTKTRKNVLAPKKSNVNKTKKETTMTKSCFCGCEQFSFKMNKEVVDNDPQHLYYNICSNCNHSLGSHIAVVRSKQAD